MRRSKSDDREPRVSPIATRGPGRRESLAIPAGSPKPLPRAATMGAAANNPSPAQINAAANNAAMVREVEDLKSTIKVLEKKRQDDRDKLKALERVQVERDKFQMIIEKLQGGITSTRIQLEGCSFKLQQRSTNPNKLNLATAGNNSRT